MCDRYKFEAYYWQAFAHLALTGKRSIEDFRADIARFASGYPLADEDVTKILTEFYEALGPGQDSTVPEPSPVDCRTKEGFDSTQSA